MSNYAAKMVLKEYLEREKPGYALLVDAPWGAGKTHFIRSETNCETDETRLYVSLYGVKTAEEFDWALVRAMKPFVDGKSAKWFEQAKGILSRVRIRGVSIDLSKWNMTEIVLSDLPNTLIFDDIERCLIEPNQLLGLINRYVEHENKGVILVANSNEFSKKKTLKTRREKLIGRTIKIEADVDAFIAAIWVDMPDGAGKGFLQTRTKILITTFTEAGHGNLRLFRQALLDTGRLVDVIEDDLVAMVEPMERLVCTHLALGMAYAGGEIGDGDIIKRGAWSRLSRKKKSNLSKLQDRHPACSIMVRYSGLISVDLGVSLFVKGFASPETIDEELRELSVFQDSSTWPDWITLWHWRKMPTDDLRELLTKINQDLDARKITTAGELLQIFGCLKAISVSGGIDESVQELIHRFVEMIETLKSESLLNPRHPPHSAQDGYGWELHDTTVVYERYGFELNDDDMAVLDACRDAQDFLFERGLEIKAQDLLEKLREHPKKFIHELEYSNDHKGFHVTPILQLINVDDISDVLLEMFERDFEALQSLCECLGHRNRSIEGEREWHSELVGKLQERASSKSKLFGAQISRLIAQHFKP